MRNLWKVSILVIFIIVGILFFYLTRIKEIRENVLAQLKERLKFCEVVKDEINVFYGNGRFWLICNGRPFYAEYLNNSIKYELNGWGWLKNTEYWNELEGCDFYDEKDSQIVFFCPLRSETFPYNWNGVIGKIYEFNKEKFKIEKSEESNFISILKQDIENKYNFKNCILKNFNATGGRGYKPAIFLNLLCDGFEYITETNLVNLFPLIPVINIESLRLIFPNAIEIYRKNDEIIGKFKFSEIHIFPNKWRVLIKPYENIEKSIEEISISIFPKKEIKEFKVVKEEKFSGELPSEIKWLKILYYKINDEVIKIYLTEEGIIYIERVWEGFYEI